MPEDVDPSDLTWPMRKALLFLAGDDTPPRARGNPLRTATVAALERRRMVEWEHTEQHTGWKLTDKGRFAVAWLRAQPSGGDSRG